MSGTVIVRIKQGRLQGKTAVTDNGVSYYSFQGIPYAKPPTGALRFKAPQEPDSWSGVRNALADGSPCPQIEKLFKEDYKGDEDCLFLNVYTPKIPRGEQFALKAVMVWIHGGAFSSGCTSTTVFGPQYIVENDVVLVTINYRIGALGFLSTGDSVVPGNNGLKDQVLALRWVQQNIAQFGGDPGNVTIFGESSGGTSVQFHLLSPLSQGIFHRAIAQSGSCLSDWAVDRKPRLRAFRFGQALGCKTDDSQKLVEYLRAVPARQLVEAVDDARKFEEERDLGIVFFGPTVEPNTSTEEVFLPEHPEILIANGKFQKVPFITGAVAREGLITLKEVMDTPSLLERYNERFELLVPEYLKAEKTPEKSQEVIRRIRKFYFGEEAISKQTLAPYILMNGDAMVLHGVYRFAKMLSALSPEPVYFYIFTFDGKWGLMKKAVGCTEFRGPCHGDELPYIFHVSWLGKMGPVTKEMQTMTRIVKLWTNFSKTGNPTPDDDKLLAIKWTPVTSSGFQCMNIGPTLDLSNNHELKERMEFWESLYQEAGPTGM